MPEAQAGVSSVFEIPVGNSKDFHTAIIKLRTFDLDWESINHLFSFLRECDRKFPDETMDFLMTSLVNGKVEIL